MCGIFYLLSNNKKIILQENDIRNIIEKIKYRGPDKTNILKKDNEIYVHTLLAIQGL